MICDLVCVYFGDGIYAFKTTIKGEHFKSIIEASCWSEALKKADLNIKNKLWSAGLKFGKGGLQFTNRYFNIKDLAEGKSPENNKNRVWYIEQTEDGKIIPKKLNAPLMTEDEAKTYVLSLLFK